MTVGQLARRVGIRPSAIRYYEARGLLPRAVRSANAYRLYGPDAVSVLRFVVRSKQLGFSLSEARQLLDNARDDPPCTLCRHLVERHLEAIERELRQMRSRRDHLKQLLRRPPAPRTDDAICPLIEIAS